jgi:hypothetical protein
MTLAHFVTSSLWDKTQRKDESLSSSDFQWDELADEYRCPQGHALRSQWRAFQNPRNNVTKADTIVYRSSQSDCAACPMKARCCPNTLFRKIARSVHESARDVSRAVDETDAYKQSGKDRKKVEMLCAHLKRFWTFVAALAISPSGVCWVRRGRCFPTRRMAT